jgi:large subunit ribosomal protein L3
MKRHGFAGGPSDERGSTKFHRRPGCIGSGRKKSRVWPGQKMPGHVGGDFRTMAGLQILRINYKYNVIYVMGQAVPGEPGEMIKVFDTNIPLK